MSKEDIDRLAASMTEEEMRARAEAAAEGQRRILEVAVGSLIMTSPYGDVVKSAILGTLAELKNAEPDHPALAWAPPAIHAGAKAAADRILSLHESVKAKMDRRQSN